MSRYREGPEKICKSLIPLNHDRNIGLPGPGKVKN